MTKIAIIGGGVVGAAIAYELSQYPQLDITLIEQNTPASGSTGAALGVLMGIISHKTKGRLWKLRQNSIERYETLIPELEHLTGDTIPYNRQGILMLRFADEAVEGWQRLIKIRESQGYPLETWDKNKLSSACPQIQHETVIGAIYSPRDRQLDPTALTQTLLKGASLKGVNCKFGLKVKNCFSKPIKSENEQQCTAIQTQDGIIDLDYLIIAAGLGSTPLTEHLNQSVDIRPVLGQALRVKLDKSFGNLDFQPVITGNDVHIVPLGQNEYWIGATVEFPDEQGEVAANEELLEKVREEAIAFCPILKDATILQQWQGKRPRPQGQPAPIIQYLEGYNNVLLATGHYRNGVLLAAATGIEVAKMLNL